MANTIATTHTGITVLCLYPTPKGRNAPLGMYAKPGFITWKMPNRIKKSNTENGTLYMRIIFREITPVIVAYMM